MGGGTAKVLLGNFRETGQHWGSMCGPALRSSRSLVTWFWGGFLLWRSGCGVMGRLLIMYLWQVARRWISFRGPLAGGSISRR
ncbi:hypothetical protein L873DRAFT_1207881 [Choiromyces venosus 120613-1]|uniref:Uncharacterized protein n=1 Tax=Choiromyces venosus 120613-1 TaxID=1336337 RepID=A0A3N4JJT2_9PEZI|nr:hypothetical protein L873DRAFT_1207881 [Choiromyces venosus 120613-1]